MRSRFPGYFEPSKADFDELWKKALIVPDTNVLLHLLRFRKETREQILTVLKNLKDRIWIPNRVAFEFSRSWMITAEENRNSYSKLMDELKSTGNKLSSQFDDIARFQIIDAKKEKTKIDAFIRDLCDSVEMASKKHLPPEEVEAIVSKVASLFAGAVGDPPDKDMLQGWNKEASQRYANKIPPGYEDDKKNNEDKYGDYIIWREIIAAAKKGTLPVIFVSDDRKEDWALIYKGQDKGPRPELLQEFWEETGQKFYSYSLNVFLEHAKKYVRADVSAEAIKEVETQAQQRIEIREDQEASFFGALGNLTNLEGVSLPELKLDHRSLMEIRAFKDALEKSAAAHARIISSKEMTPTERERELDVFFESIKKINELNRVLDRHKSSFADSPWVLDPTKLPRKKDTIFD